MCQEDACLCWPLSQELRDSVLQIVSELIMGIYFISTLPLKLLLPVLKSLFSTPRTSAVRERWCCTWISVATDSVAEKAVVAVFRGERLVRKYKESKEEIPSFLLIVGSTKTAGYIFEAVQPNLEMTNYGLNSVFSFWRQSHRSSKFENFFLNSGAVILVAWALWWLGCNSFKKQQNSNKTVSTSILKTSQTSWLKSSRTARKCTRTALAIVTQNCAPKLNNWLTNLLVRLREDEMLSRK